MAHAAAAKRSYLLCEFLWGDPLDPEVEYLTDYTTEVPFEGNDYKPLPEMDVALTARAGILSESPTTVRLPLELGRLQDGEDANEMWVERMTNGEICSPVYLTVLERSIDDASEDTLYMFVGTMSFTRTNPDGDTGVASIEFVTFKPLIRRKRLGIRADFQCAALHLGDKICQAVPVGPLADGVGGITGVKALVETVTVDSLDGHDVTLLGHDSHGEDDLTGRYWHMGYVQKDGMSIRIHEWTIPGQSANFLPVPGIASPQGENTDAPIVDNLWATPEFFAAPFFWRVVLSVAGPAQSSITTAIDGGPISSVYTNSDAPPGKQPLVYVGIPDSNFVEGAVYRYEIYAHRAVNSLIDIEDNSPDTVGDAAFFTLEIFNRNTGDVSRLTVDWDGGPGGEPSVHATSSPGGGVYGNQTLEVLQDDWARIAVDIEYDNSSGTPDGFECRIFPAGFATGTPHGVSHFDPARHTLTRIPGPNDTSDDFVTSNPLPLEFLGQTVELVPGCSRELDVCQKRWNAEDNFLGLGFGMPPVNKNVETEQ